MTGVDFLVTMFFAFCVAHAPVDVEQHGNAYAVTIYECPLMRDPATFYLWRHVCPDKIVQHGVAVWGEDHKGFVLNQFGQAEPAYLDAESMTVYFPTCP